MIDVNKLLTAVLAGGADPSSSRNVALPSDRVPPTDREAGGRPAGGGSNPFSLPQTIGAAASGRGSFGEFLSRNAGLFGGGAIAGGLTGVLLNSKHARKFAGTALQVGAAAMLGGLAYKAFQDYRAGRPVIPQGLQEAIQGMLAAGAGPAAAAAAGRQAARLTERTGEHTATLLLRAMIASAMADGRIDAVERQRLIDRVEASELSQDERVFLETLIEKPDPPAALAASVASPEEAAQVYLAAFIAIDADTPAERAWLEELAEKLALDPRLRSNLESAGGIALSQAA